MMMMNKMKMVLLRKMVERNMKGRREARRNTKKMMKLSKPQHRLKR